MWDKDFITDRIKQLAGTPYAVATENTDYLSVLVGSFDNNQTMLPYKHVVLERQNIRQVNELAPLVAKTETVSFFPVRCHFDGYATNFKYSITLEAVAIWSVVEFVKYNHLNTYMATFLSHDDRYPPEFGWKDRVLKATLTLSGWNTLGNYKIELVDKVIEIVREMIPYEI